MAFTFRAAAREDVSLLIGLSGGTGSGKTYSAMRLAKGIAGDRPFAVIDTEAGRAKHYADAFRFDHGDLLPPFTPDAYANAIAAADTAKYPVIVVDSASHEWAGEGGVLEAQEAELYRMAKDDYTRREACKMASWIKPKTAHKHMVQRLLQVRAHLILCFRAEPKIEMVKGAEGKWEIREKQSLTGLHGWMPICEKNLPFEMTASFLLMADRPGVPQPIKLQQQHRALFPLDQPITEACGAALDVWARGGSKAPAVDWPARIREATTPAALKAIGKQLDAVKATITADTRTALRAQFKARMETLLAAPRSAAPTAEEVFK
jgi:AAA domain